jgi:hypothetical protein
MRKSLLLGLSVLSGAAAAACIWLLMLFLGPYHPVALRTMAEGGTWFFEWDLIAALSVLCAIYLAIARFTALERPIRIRFRVAFIVAFLFCLSLSFEKIYIDSDLIIPSSALHETPAR